jgi:hypothetical protein
MWLFLRFSSSFISFLLLWVVLYACTSSDTGAVEEVECYVRYLKPEGQSLAEMIVRRREQKETRSVEVPGGARYNGAPMQAIVSDDAVTYRSEGKSAFASQHIFSWKDARSRPHEFAIEMLPVSDLSFGSQTLSIKQQATLRWQGPPISENEAWVVLWEKTDRSATVPMEIITAAGMDYIEFPAAQLAKLGPGSWSYYVVRQKAFRQEKPGYIIKGVAEYYSDADTVQLVN